MACALDTLFLAHSVPCSGTAFFPLRLRDTIFVKKQGSGGAGVLVVILRVGRTIYSPVDNFRGEELRVRRERTARVAVSERVTQSIKEHVYKWPHLQPSA